MSINYEQSGVNIEAGENLVDWLQSSDAQKNNPLSSNIVSGIGGFASLFRLPIEGMKDPCLITCTDGVGTKVKLASHFGRYQEVGQDLVAMCVNDLICTGGTPLLFLDYYATSKLELSAAQDFLTGVRNACDESGCLLIGGETAEMPGVYHGSDFDCAGFSVGMVDREKALGPEKIKSGLSEGVALVGVASSGFHSNGFSLIRKLFAEDLEQWGDQLLTPTRLYPRLSKELCQSFDVLGMAHITGGGIDNILRVLPKGARAHLKKWEWPELFKEAQKRAEISDQEMLKTFNCGLGLVVALPKNKAESCLAKSEELGFSAWVLGDLADHPESETAEPDWVFES